MSKESIWSETEGLILLNIVKTKRNTRLICKYFIFVGIKIKKNIMLKKPKAKCFIGISLIRSLKTDKILNAEKSTIRTVLRNI